MKVPEGSTGRRGLIFVLGSHRITTGVDDGIRPTDVLCSFHQLEMSHVTRPYLHGSLEMFVERLRRQFWWTCGSYMVFEFE